MSAQKSGNALKVVCLEGPKSGQMLQLHVELILGATQTVVPDLDTLKKHLGETVSLPDAILVYDSAIPAESLSDMFNGVRLLSDVRLANEMDGVKALKLLKDPESPVRHVPVIIFGAYSPEPFQGLGAAAVLTSEDLGHDIGEILLSAMNDALDAEIVPDVRHPGPATLIKPAERVTSVEIQDLEGEQLDQFQSFLILQAEAVSKEEGLLEFMENPGFQHWIGQYPGLLLEMQNRGGQSVATASARVLQSVSVRILDEKLACKSDVMKAISEELARLGEPPNRITFLISSLAAAQAMYEASQTASRIDAVAEFAPYQLEALRDALWGQVAWLETTDTLGIDKAMHSLELLGTETDTDDIQERLSLIDEEAAAREVAQALRLYIDKLDTEASYESAELLQLMDYVPADDDARDRAVYMVTKAIEAARTTEADPFDTRYTEDQVERAAALLDERARDRTLGVQTRGLLSDAAERLKPGMSLNGFRDIIGTLAQFPKYGGIGGWPERNVLREAELALRRAAMPEAFLPPPGPGPAP